MTDNPYRYPTETIKPRRLAAGMTQRQLSIALDVQLETIRQWEQGRTGQPRPAMMHKIDAILGPPTQQENEQ